jgi:AraC-like DNA-binding protein
MYSYKYNNPFNEPTSKMDLKLYNCGTEDCECGLSWGPAIKDHYKLFYIKSGKGMLEVGGKTYNLSKGQCFIICPEVITSYIASSDEPWIYYWVAFNGINAQTYLSRANLSINNPVIGCNNEEDIIDCFTNMFQGSEASNSGDMRMLSYFYLLLATISDLKNSNCNETEPYLQDNSYVKKALEWIEVNYSSNISIAEMADFIGINRKYFSKIFKESVGTSPQNFLINFRLNKACELLKKDNLSIGEVSRSVGYEDQLLFSRVFKKFKGESPNLFRKKYKEAFIQLDT